jgi:long-chain acyl-CoA synthetase
LRLQGIATYEIWSIMINCLSAQWIATSHSCVTQSISIVTAYDSLGQSGLEHSLLQSQAEVIYIDPYLLKTATEPLKKSKVHTVIVNESSIFGGLEMVEYFKSENPRFNVVSFNEVVELGKSTPVEPVFPKTDDLYCVMYTSGSGGVPKGVRIAHKNLVAGGKSRKHSIRKKMMVDSKF